MQNHDLRRRLNSLNKFRLPRWDDLPDEGLMRQKMLDYIDELLSPLLDKDQIITGTMVENYIKWGMAPSPAGRKYNRVHFAHFIVLSILKEVTAMQNISHGIILQTKIIPLSAAYDSFCQLLEDALKRQTSTLLQEIESEKNVEIQGFETSLKTLNLAFVCEALVNKLLAESFILEQGLFNSFHNSKNTENSNSKT